MPVSRRDFLRTTIGGVGCASAGSMLLTDKKAGADDELPDVARHSKPHIAGENAFKYRIGFGCWMNDMRCKPLPLENWPAPKFDDECVDSIIRCMDVQQEAGYNMIDVWGYFGTYGWPADIVSSMDKDRSRRLKRVLKAAHDRGIKPILGFGTYSWGYTEIIKKDPSVMGKTFDGRPNPGVLCDAVPKSFDYVKRMLDFALGEYDFGGVHLESCDMGCCQCRECTQKHGFVGYNVRINAKTADYIKSKWPDHTVYSITISWLQGHPHFNAEEKAHLVELSKHVDCIFDQGHSGFHIDPAERRDFIKQLHCAYGTSGELWLYPDVRWDRASFFLPYIKRAVTGLKNQYQDGVRACLHYQGPVSNAGTEAQIAAGGRVMSDPGKSVEDILGDVIDVYYKPATEQAAQAAHGPVPPRGGVLLQQLAEPDTLIPKALRDRALSRRVQAAQWALGHNPRSRLLSLGPDARLQGPAGLSEGAGSYSGGYSEARRQMRQLPAGQYQAIDHHHSHAAQHDPHGSDLAVFEGALGRMIE